MADGTEIDDGKIVLGRPYRFTKNQFEYCVNKGVPTAVIYYDSKTSAASKSLYEKIFKSKTEVKNLWSTLKTEGSEYLGGYCCLFVLDRCGQIGDPNDNIKYFVNNVLPSGKTYEFPILALVNGNKKSFQTLTSVSGSAQLAQTLRQKGESGSGGVEQFSHWAKRQSWIDKQVVKPEAETKAPGTRYNDEIATNQTPAFYRDPTAKKKIEDYDPGTTKGEFSGIAKIGTAGVPYLGGTCMLDLTDIATPETTYCLIGAYDAKNPSACPKSIDAYFSPYMEKCCDNIVKVWDREALQTFRSLFEKGAKYRYFVFFEFSHGRSKVITIGITYDEIWNTLAAMAPHQRVWGMFDSCHSGSMIVNMEAATASADDDEDEGTEGGAPATDDDLLTFINNKISRRSSLMAATSAASGTLDSHICLWSSTGPNSYGWYYPTSDAVFMKAIKKTLTDAISEDTDWSGYTYSGLRYGWAKTYTGTAKPTKKNWSYDDDNTNGAQVFKRLQLNGSAGNGSNELNTCVPRCAYYPSGSDSFKKTIIFY